MSRYKLTIEYEGTPYKGWQINKGETTIQGKILEVCEKVFKTQTIELYGAGRTDAGVHAIGQVAHLDVVTNLKPLQIQHALNDELPASINIISVEPIHNRFHARHHATARSYVYVISRRRSAFFKKNMWWIKDTLNAEAMNKASKQFLGLKDFSSFGRKTQKDESTKVEIQHIEIHQKENTILIHIVGSHFLWNQVRRMVGVLVEVGRGKMTQEHIRQFLKEENERPSQLTAPPSGLYLEHVYYDDEPIKLMPIWPIVVH